MRHVLVTLRAHGDLTKIEFEDAILRQIIPARIDTESSLFGIDADVRAVDQAGFGAGSDGPSALLTFSSLDEPGLTADDISTMVMDVATPTAAYVTDAGTVGEDPDTWIGRATPGTKLVAFLARSAGAGDAAFDEWVDSAGDALGATAGPGRVVVHHVLDTLMPSPQIDAVVTVRFPSNDARTAAIESGLPELESDLVEVAGSHRVLVFEHRFHADPNHWGAGSAPPPSVA